MTGRIYCGIRFALQRIRWVLLLIASLSLAAFAQTGSPTFRVIIPLAAVDLVDLGSPGLPTRLSLPARLQREKRELGRFRISAEFELPPDFQDQRWVLYAQDLRDGGTLYLNGMEIGTVPSATEHVTVRHLQPFMFDLPPSVMRAGRNSLAREWSVVENQISVPRLFVGTHQAVAPIYEKRYFWQYTMAQVSFVFGATIAFILLGLYSKNRGVHQYLWAGGSALGWAILNLFYFLTPIPAGLYAYWQLLNHFGVWAFTAGGSFYLLQDCAVPSRRYRQVSITWGVAFWVSYCVNYWLTGRTFWPTYTLSWHVGLAVLGVYPMVRLGMSLWREPRLRHGVYLAINLAVIAAGLLDAATISGFSFSPSNGYLLQAVIPVWFAAICLALINDFSRSLRSQKEQQLRLVEQLDAQKKELQRLHDLERVAQAKQASDQERARIMQDMHDGLGSQLVSSLAMAQSGGLSTTQTYDLLRSCIDDLRLAIDTSTDSGDSLALALGNLRFRMEPRLKAAGITLKWNTLELADDLPLPAHQQLPLLRMIQETLTNVLKHAQAKTLTVRIASTPQDLSIDIRDDGAGFDVAAAVQAARGKGLNSLEKRARTLGASLHIDSSSQGTHTHLNLPLPAG